MTVKVWLLSVFMNKTPDVTLDREVKGQIFDINLLLVNFVQDFLRFC